MCTLSNTMLPQTARLRPLCTPSSSSGTPRARAAPPGRHKAYHPRASLCTARAALTPLTAHDSPTVSPAAAAAAAAGGNTADAESGAAPTRAVTQPAPPQPASRGRPSIVDCTQPPPPPDDALPFPVLAASTLPPPPPDGALAILALAAGTQGAVNPASRTARPLARDVAQAARDGGVGDSDNLVFDQGEGRRAARLSVDRATNRTAGSVQRSARPAGKFVSAWGSAHPAGNQRTASATGTRILSQRPASATGLRDLGADADPGPRGSAAPAGVQCAIRTAVTKVTGTGNRVGQGRSSSAVGSTSRTRRQEKEFQKIGASLAGTCPGLVTIMTVIVGRPGARRAQTPGPRWQVHVPCLCLLCLWTSVGTTLAYFAALPSWLNTQMQTLVHTVSESLW